ncbi:MAG: hypothetical protein JXA82_09865 [Sedimentisphaerales bacterium]|nr:hypothetical protein [Sedimentisphaerales bacterium]
MFNIRLKQIECAMRDGQLDEAYRLIQDDSKLGQCRKGQKLTARLAQAITRRGNEHLSAERLSHALNDCNKADKLGGNRNEIAELRRAICKVMEAKQYTHQQRAQMLANAQEQIDKGWLTVGVNILDTVEHPDADRIKQQAQTERKKSEAAVEKVEQALKRDDLTGAIELLLYAGPGRNQHAPLAELCCKVKARATDQIADQLNQGWIDVASHLLEKADALDCGNVDLNKFRDALKHCHRAANDLYVGHCRQAAQSLAKLKLLLPHAKWISEAHSQAQKAAEAMDILHTGPLGLLEVQSSENEVSQEMEQEAIFERKTEPMQPKSETAANNDTLPSRFVMQIDGVGAFLTVRDSKVTIGPISSSQQPTLALMAAAHLPTATIERHDEDYILRSGEPIHIGERQISEKLLTDGDKIALSMRCRMRFHKPNAASTTATLQLSSARLPRPDINHVILMDREILVGPGIGNHIRTNDIHETITFYMKNDRLYCRTDEPLIIEGKSGSKEMPLPLDTAIQVGKLNLVLARRCE